MSLNTQNTILDCYWLEITTCVTREDDWLLKGGVTYACDVISKS